MIIVSTQKIKLSKQRLPVPSCSKYEMLTFVDKIDGTDPDSPLNPQRTKMAHLVQTDPL
jgi:hypothetical protein